MLSQKRSRLQQSDYLMKKPRLNTDSSPVNYRQDVWKIISKLNHNCDLETNIKYGIIFIKLTETQSAHISEMMNELTQAVDAEKIYLGTDFIQLRNFHLLDCCIWITFISIILNKQWSKLNDMSMHSIQKPFVLRGSLFVHKSCKVAHSFVQKRSSFQLKLASITEVPGFKQIYFQSNDLRDFVQGILNYISQWRFRPVKTPIISTFTNSLAIKQNIFKNTIAELPFFSNLMDLNLVVSNNESIIEQSREQLNLFMQDLDKYNNNVTVEICSTQENSKSSRYSGYSHSRYSGSAKNTVNRAGEQSSLQVNNQVSQGQVLEYSLATIKASIDAIGDKSPYQITKVYIKCPKQKIIDLIYQNLNELRSSTNCNIVILNLQTVHESKLWFGSLRLDNYYKLGGIPHPSCMRVISIGGIGDHCKRALNLILKIVETGCI